MKKFIQQKVQVLLTVGLQAVQVAIMLVWFLVRKELTTVEYVDHQSVTRICSDGIDLGFLFGMAYPLTLLIACLILATINHKVPEGFNETRIVGG